jgi:ABC-type uncharacterized transport system involved in gliding motility auxiliary subunit
VIKGSTLGVGVLLVLALVGIANYLGGKYYARFDWTSSNLYSLSERSRNVLADLEKQIDVTVMLAPASDAFAEATELLTRYESESPFVSVRVVDPERNLTEAQLLVDRYELGQLDVVVFDSGEDRRIVEANELMEYDYSAMQYGGAPQVTGFKGEQLFTGAILELVESRKPKILFTTGHGEPAIDDFSGSGLSDLRDLLGRDNFEIDEWASLGAGPVPEGTDLVVVAGPRSGFVEPEVEALRDFLGRGGRLVLMVDPTLSDFGGLEPTGLEELLDEHGVLLGQDIIVDPGNPLPFFGPDTLFVSDFRDHDITRSLRQANLQVIVPLARSVRAGEAVDGLEISELFTTSDDGWGETDLENLTAVEKQEDDLVGPVPLAVAVAAAPTELDDAAGEVLEPVGGDEEPVGELASEPSAQTRLVVIGDSDFTRNDQIRNASNGVLVANIFNWLVERDALVGIPPKTPEQTKLNLTSAQLSTITWLVLVILPGLAVAAGVATHLRRRR